MHKGIYDFIQGALGIKIGERPLNSVNISFLEPLNVNNQRTTIPQQNEPTEPQVEEENEEDPDTAYPNNILKQDW